MKRILWNVYVTSRVKSVFGKWKYTCYRTHCIEHILRTHGSYSQLSLSVECIRKLAYEKRIWKIKVFWNVYVMWNMNSEMYV